MRKTFEAAIRRLSAKKNKEPDEQDLRIAAASLLVHAAMIDGVYEEAEHERLHELLQNRFDLEDAATAELLEEAKEREANAVDIYSFTRVLTKQMGQEERQGIVEMLWEVVFADGQMHEYESNLVWRASELLGVGRRDRLRLRDKIRRNHKSE